MSKHSNSGGMLLGSPNNQSIAPRPAARAARVVRALKHQGDIMQLVGKTALITGAGGGIGRAMAHALAEDGAKLALVDLDANSLDVVKKEVEATGGNAIALPIDLTYPGALDSMVDDNGSPARLYRRPHQ